MEKLEDSVQLDDFTEGTHHQLALGGQAKRKHIFSPLDAVYASAVHKDAEMVEFTPEEEVCNLSLDYLSSTRICRGKLRGR